MEWCVCVSGGGVLLCGARRYEGCHLTWLPEWVQGILTPSLPPGFMASISCPWGKDRRAPT